MRDIAGIYFLVDIEEKRYYKDKVIPSFNDTGKELIKIMYKLQRFDEIEVYKEFILLINYVDFELEEIIKNDISEFIKELIDKGYLEEV